MLGHHDPHVGVLCLTSIDVRVFNGVRQMKKIYLVQNNHAAITPLPPKFGIAVAQRLITFKMMKRYALAMFLLMLRCAVAQPRIGALVSMSLWRDTI